MSGILINSFRRFVYAVRKARYPLKYYLKFRRFKNGNVVFSSRARLEDHIEFRFVKDALLKIDGNSMIGRYSKIVMVGGVLRIGEDCTIGQNNIFNVFDDITLGRKVLTADRVSFITNRHEYRDIHKAICDQGGQPGPIEIGDGTWLGLNAVVLAGTKIGRNCVVGANSVVRGEFGDYEVIVGAPARVVKRYDLVSQEWKSVQ